MRRNAKNPLIDTHQHLIYPDVAGFGWTNDIPELTNKSFTLDDYKNLVSSEKVGPTIFMEAGVDDADYQTEARFVEDSAKNPTSKIVGMNASCRPETDDGFDYWLEECGGLNVVGFRRILHTVPDDLSKSVDFRQNVRKPFQFEKQMQKSTQI